MIIQAIFFDFNGVIIDDEPVQLKAYQEVLAAEGIELTQQQYYDALGMDDRMFVRSQFERAGKPHGEATLQNVIERKSELHRELLGSDLPLFPGVVTFLSGASGPYALGMVSMARRKEIDFLLEGAALAHLFDVIVSAEDVSACKPDPECFRRGLERLNEKRRTARLLPLLAAECLVIEDSPPGIEAARAAGMRTMGLTNTVAAAALRSAGAEIVTASLADWNLAAIPLLFDREAPA